MAAMWLDRFSAHTTPSHSPPPPQQGTRSPAPRRGPYLQPQRPAVNPRSSSLAPPSPSISTTSLPGRGGIANGSSLKNEIDSSPADHVQDPLIVLQRILGLDLTLDSSEHDQSYANGDRPEELEADVDFNGLSLQEFVDAPVLLEEQPPHVQTYSEKSVEEFAKERHTFEDLHKSILSCDDVLKSVEGYLSSFKTDLSAVSAEIETLQSRSASLNSKLDNRQRVEKLLGPIVERMALSPHVVKKIADGPIDQVWIKSLEDLQKRAKTIQSDSNHNTKVFDDINPMIEQLSDKAVERIRDYFASRIKALRSPNINAQIIQRQDFLRNKSLFAFLAQRQPELAENISLAYANTMRWYYLSHFTRYREALSKLALHTTDQYDVLGADAARKSSTTTTRMPGHDPFNLGRRLDVLKNPVINALPASTAEDSKTPAHFETTFLAFNLALVDNASCEYSFLANFLPSSFSAHNRISRQLTTIFTPTFELGYATTQTLIAESYDALGILLAVRLTQHFAFILQRRCVPTLESYINGTNMLLWPRFQSVMDAHCESLKKLTASLPSRPAGTSAGSAAFAALSGVSASTGASPSTAPLPVTQRFASLLHGILSLSSEARDDEPVSSSLSRLRGDFENLLAKLGNGFGAGEKGRREKERFFANNYSLILTILADVKGKLANESKEHFEALRGHVGILAAA